MESKTPLESTAPIATTTPTTTAPTTDTMEVVKEEYRMRRKLGELVLSMLICGEPEDSDEKNQLEQEESWHQLCAVEKKLSQQVNVWTSKHSRLKMDMYWDMRVATFSHEYLVSFVVAIYPLPTSLKRETYTVEDVSRLLPTLFGTDYEPIGKPLSTALEALPKTRKCIRAGIIHKKSSLELSSLGKSKYNIMFLASLLDTFPLAKNLLTASLEPYLRGPKPTSMNSRSCS